MSDEFLEFGRVQYVDAEAIGEPGQRTFRLVVLGKSHSASLWLEREQLEQLSLAIDQLVAQVTGGDILRPEALASPTPAPGAPADFPDDPTVDVHVSTMQLKYLIDRDLLSLTVAPLEFSEQEDELVIRQDATPVLTFLFTKPQAVTLNQHVMSILASGRPRCPFCGRPMEPQHVCAKQNGYHPVGLN